MFKSFILVGGDKFVLNRTVQAHHKPIIPAWKEATHSDVAFQKDGIVYFCSTITEAEIVEEINNNQIKEN